MIGVPWLLISVMENILLEVNSINSSFKVVTKTVFLGLSIIDILRQIILVVKATLCITDV